MLAEDDLVNVVGAYQLGDYSLLLQFSDGHKQAVDFGPFLMASMNPLIRRYLDPDMFMQFRIEAGDLLWGDYELCFPVADLYENRI